jgi:propanediol dehydratase small subunit
MTHDNFIKKYGYNNVLVYRLSHEEILAIVDTNNNYTILACIYFIKGGIYWKHIKTKAKDYIKVDKQKILISDFKKSNLCFLEILSNKQKGLI